MKILNLYAGIGGNRKLWSDEHEITSVELEPYIADAYREMFPNDEVIVSDAHAYLLANFQRFDFIWSSPPCPSHSKLNNSLQGFGIYRYPDMKLYEEIIFLNKFFKGTFCIENVIPYYDPLIKPEIEIDRHLFWSNFKINAMDVDRDFNLSKATKERLSDFHNIVLPVSTKDKRKLLRNCVHPETGLHILNCATKINFPYTLV